MLFEKGRSPQISIMRIKSVLVNVGEDGAVSVTS